MQTFACGSAGGSRPPPFSEAHVAVGSVRSARGVRIRFANPSPEQRARKRLRVPLAPPEMLANRIRTGPCPGVPAATTRQGHAAPFLVLAGSSRRKLLQSGHALFLIFAAFSSSSKSFKPLVWTQQLAMGGKKSLGQQDVFPCLKGGFGFEGGRFAELKRFRRIEETCVGHRGCCHSRWNGWCARLPEPQRGLSREIGLGYGLHKGPLRYRHCQSARDAVVRGWVLAALRLQTWRGWRIRTGMNRY